ncbi:hypothetical protein BSLG_004325 [Batrachochytrium salamandrivorans]|nr:hypothetical protein BSLG_004325 [Batrachochytrium salamandrivorans]
MEGCIRKPKWTKARDSESRSDRSYDWTGDVLACPEKNQWGLTYDDGQLRHTNVVLDLLKANNVKATFFVVGSQVLQNPEILLRAYNEGHQIALHTWSHASLPKADMGVAIAEVVYNAMVVKQVIGVTPASSVHHVNGEISRSVREMLKKLGLTITMWNVDSRDEQTKYAAVTLEAIIKQGSFKPMPVAQCLGTPAYDESFWTKLVSQAGSSDAGQKKPTTNGMSNDAVFPKLLLSLVCFRL